jgi:hypothetical protein
LTQGFPIHITAQPPEGETFNGKVWLLTDSDNFAGPNFMYLQMAAEAGFTIVYEENPQSKGWDTRPIRLPYTGVSLRFNPLYFTDREGHSLEGAGAMYHYRLNGGTDALLALILP